MGMLELLGVVCILSISLAPLFYLVRLTRTTERRSEAEFTATLLAQHVMERIVAMAMKNPSSLPPMTAEEPIVAEPDGSGSVSEYFRFLLGEYRTITPEDSPKLYWALKPFKCQVDTYYLEDRLYKLIVYISYDEEGRKKRIYLERLLDISPGEAATKAEAPTPVVRQSDSVKSAESHEDVSSGTDLSEISRPPVADIATEASR
ncbi:MAG: hypothetical protein HQM09_00270 [Candidatus Riflebacteria bacterium]|nr:hypothetical protein [Candidatus Riflebacteria bacterium]